MLFVPYRINKRTASTWQADPAKINRWNSSWNPHPLGRFGRLIIYKIAPVLYSRPPAKINPKQPLGMAARAGRSNTMAHPIAKYKAVYKIRGAFNQTSFIKIPMTATPHIAPKKVNAFALSIYAKHTGV